MSLSDRFISEFEDQLDEIDPPEEDEVDRIEWFSFIVGWAMGKGLSFAAADSIARKIYFETNFGMTLRDRV